MIQVNNEIDFQGCPYGEKCPLYTYLKQMQRLHSQPETYSPMDLEIFLKRERSSVIRDYATFESRVLRRHCCSLQEIKNTKGDKDMYDKIIQSMDKTSTSPVMDITFNNWFRVFFNQTIKGNVKFLIEEEKEEPKVITSIRINNVEECITMKCEDNYFKSVDVFEIYGDKEEDDVVFSLPNKDVIKEEYFMMVRKRYSLEERVQFYKNYLRKYPINVPLWANEYNDPTSFHYYFEKQISIYIDILSKVQTRGRFFFVGDGPGTASVAAIILGLSYVSNEPNDIGEMACQLGIITARNITPQKEDIVCMFQVRDHIGARYDKFNKLIIVEEFLKDKMPGLIPVKTGGGKVFVKNVKIDRLKSFPIVSNKFFFNRNDGKVKPMDVKSEAVAYITGVGISKDGKEVTADINSPYMNIITRNDPTNNRVKTTGSVKQVGNSYVTLYPGDNIVYLEDTIKEVKSESYKFDRYPKDYYMVDSLYYIKTPVPDRVVGVVSKDDNQIIRLYLIKKMKQDGIMMGVYQDYLTVNNKSLRDSQESSKDIVNKTTKRGHQKIKEKKKDDEFEFPENVGYT